MTTAFFSVRDGRYTGFCVTGHSGYADAGQDIVCAAASSAAAVALNALCETDESAESSVGPAKLSVSVHETGRATENIFRALVFQLANIAGNYPDNLRVCRLSL